MTNPGTQHIEMKDGGQTVAAAEVTTSPGPRRRRHGPSQNQCHDRHERENPGIVGTAWDGLRRTANAVRVRALPGFKSPSLRRLTWEFAPLSADTPGHPKDRFRLLMAH